MPTENEGLQFSKLDLTENQNDDIQEEETRKDYNPISEITKLESFGFEFEPDEDIGEEEEYKVSSTHNEVKPLEEDLQQHEELTDEIAMSNYNEDEDVLLIPNDTVNSEIQNYESIENIEVEVAKDSYIDYAGAENEIKPNNNKTSADDQKFEEQDLTLNNSNIDNEINLLESFQDDFNNLENEVIFDSSFNVADEIELQENTNNTNLISEENEDQDGFIDNTEEKDEEGVIKEEHSSNELNPDIEIKEGISEEEAEDILAQVMSQDFSVPIEGFEKYAERKRLREEASKALDGTGYNELDIEFDDRDEEIDSLKEVSDYEILKDKNSILDDDILSSTDIDDDEELELDLNSEEEEIGDLFSNDYIDVDLSEIPEIDSNADESKFEELLNGDSNNIEENIHTDIGDIDISDITSINTDDDDDENKYDVLFDSNEEEAFDDDDYDDVLDLETRDVDEDILENDDFSISAIDFNDDDSEEFNDENFSISNLDNDKSDDEDSIDDEFNFDDFDQADNNNEDDDGFDDGGFNIDFGSSNDNDDDDEDEFDFSDSEDMFSDSDSDLEDFEFDNINIDFDDEEVASSDDNEFDDFDIEEYGDSNGSDYKDKELTKKTKEYLVKIKSLIRNLPTTSKNLASKTKEYLNKLKEIRREIKEEGFKPTSKKYCIQVIDFIKDSAINVNSTIKEKIQPKPKLKNTRKTKSSTNDSKVKSAVKLDEWDGGDGGDTWGLGPAAELEVEDDNSVLEVNNDEADWEDDDIEEDLSFSTADMLMEDEELGLEEFGGFGGASVDKDDDEEDTTDYTGVIGKFRKVKRVLYKWSKLIYKYFDSKIDFEKNWWKVVDFFAVVILMTAFAMVMAYYIWHK